MAETACPGCGAPALPGRKYCGPCGEMFRDPVPPGTLPVARRAGPRPSETTSPPPVRCPKCGGTQVSGTKAGFGVGKAAAGAILTGGVGLLAGFIGAGKVEVSCLACGTRWKAGSGA